MEEKIAQLVDDAIVALEYDDCFLVDLKVNNTRVEIYLDSDSSITFERCRKVSRQVEAVLDEKLWLGEKYTLDVSSSGVGKPLKYLRQYLKNIGRKAEILTIEDEKIKGTLVEATEEKAVIEYEQTIKEGKKKRKETVRKEVPMEAIKTTRIKISF